MIKLRNGSSMIELIIAIVVMSMAMMTLPIMLTTTQNNNTFIIQQEAILIAKTQLDNILTYPWDENSEDNNFNVGILDTNSTNYSRADRVGLVIANKRRKFFTTTTWASTIGLETGETTPDDIDDFHDKEKNLTDINDVNATLDYKLSNDLNMTIPVKYISDINLTAIFDFNETSTPTGTTNIKMVEVSLKNSFLDKDITLRAFSCNIGANQLLRRSF